MRPHALHFTDPVAVGTEATPRRGDRTVNQNKEQTTGRIEVLDMSATQLIIAAEHPMPNTPTFWLNWTKFDYIYILFTEDDAPNPDPARLKLVADGDRFQLYRIVKPQ